MKTEKTEFQVYLNFDGDCAEAMKFYTSIFKGELNMGTFAEAPMPIPESHQDRILHAVLTFDNGVLMASDLMPNQKLIRGNGTQISISEPEPDRAREIFDQLSAGGSVQMPFEKSFWGSLFGMLTDKFGVMWMINCQIEPCPEK